jgi:uncharacterized protein with FMN-binding domain
MRRTVTIALAALALTVPSVNAWAATTAGKSVPKKRVVVATKSFTGSPGHADQWGDVQVTIHVRKTTTYVGTKKTVKRHIYNINVPVYPNHTDRSVYINNTALPILVREALTAQSAHIYIVSGATYSSDAFGFSLQSAITKEKAW